MARSNPTIRIQFRVSYAGRVLIYAAQTAAWLMMPPDIDAVVRNIRTRHLWVKIGRGPWRRYGGGLAHEKPRTP